jgi:membrane protein
VFTAESSLSVFTRRLSARLRRVSRRFGSLFLFRFVVALFRKMGADDVSNMAASISYYAILSLFPLTLGLLAIFALFLPSESVQRQLTNLAAQYLPGSLSMIQNNVADIIRFRGAAGIVGILGLFWSGTGVFNVITKAVNRAWEIKFRHPFYLRKPREFGMVLGTGILFLLSMGTSAIFTSIGRLDLPFSGTLANIGTAAAAFIFSLVVFLLIHRFIPIVWVSWRLVWPGAVLSTILFEVAKTFFVFYLNHYDHYDKIYGSIASVIILLVWIYYSAFILILGAEFSSLIFRLKREGDLFDKSPEKPEIIREF